MDSREKGRHVFVTGINDLLSVKLGFFTLREAGINAESMARFSRVLELILTISLLLLP
jgi:hypothetical protein